MNCAGEFWEVRSSVCRMSYTAIKDIIFEKIVIYDFGHLLSLKLMYKGKFMDTNLLQYAFSKPLKEYLTFANYNLSDFCEQIWTQNNLILNVLSVLGKFKAYDILLPFNILIKSCFDEKQMEWWNDLISRLDNSDEISNLSKKLYKNLISSKRREHRKDISEFEYFEYAFSMAKIESFVWEVCLEYGIDICQCDNNSAVCLYIPGLYISGKKYDFWKNLDEKVFSQLLQKCQDISGSIMPNRFETALIKRTIYIFSSELGAYYYNLMRNLAVQITSFPKTDLEKINDKLLIQIIKRTNGDDFYISERWVMQLEELHKYTDRYQLKSFSCKALGFCLPLLLQCIGKYTIASKKAMSYIIQSSASDRTDEVLFLSLYIAMFTSPIEVQMRIGSILEEMFSGEYLLDHIIDVFNDMKLFFEKFSIELSMRFDKNGIKQLKEKDNLHFYALYELAIDDILQGIKSGFEEIDDTYWVLTNLFNNGKIVSAINNLLINISNEKINYSTRIIYVSHLCNLFFALASHLETEVRVCIREVSAFVEISKSDDYKRLFEKIEIFGIYNPIQVKELRELGKRIENVYENIPRYSSTLTYENNVVDYIRERIIESQKQIIGSDVRKILIV